VRVSQGILLAFSSSAVSIALGLAFQWLRLGCFGGLLVRLRNLKVAVW